MFKEGRNRSGVSNSDPQRAKIKNWEKVSGQTKYLLIFMMICAATIKAAFDSPSDPYTCPMLYSLITDTLAPHTRQTGLSFKMLDIKSASHLSRKLLYSVFGFGHFSEVVC